MSNTYSLEKDEEETYIANTNTKELIKLITLLPSNDNYFPKIICFMNTHKININYQSDYGYTAIHTLLLLKNFSIYTFQLCKLLLSHGANINITNNRQLFPLSKIMEIDITDTYHQNNYHKTNKDCYELMEFIIKNSTASLDLQNNNRNTVFHQIIMNPYSDLNLEKLEFLLKYNPDVYIENSFGLNAFHHFYLEIKNHILYVKDYEDHDNIINMCMYLRKKYENLKLFPNSKFIVISDSIKNNDLIQKLNEKILNELI